MNPEVINALWGLAIGVLAAAACWLVFIYRIGYGTPWTILAGSALGYGLGLVICLVAFLYLLGGEYKT